MAEGDGVSHRLRPSNPFDASDHFGADGETRVQLRDDGLDIQGSMRGRDGPYRR